MAAVGQLHNLADWRKGRDPDGKLARVAELLEQKNELVDDIPFKEGNLPTGHQSTVRTSLPTFSFVGMNSASTPTRSTKAQVTDMAAVGESWVEADERIANLGGDPSGYMESEFKAHAEAAAQKMAFAFLYGNLVANPLEFTGIIPRYNLIAGAANGTNVLTALGAGTDNASVLIVDWGEWVHGIYPKGSPMGLEFKNFGIETKEGSGGTLNRVYRARFSWTAGLAVSDWRRIVRICNIDISNLVGETTPAPLTKLLTKALYRLPSAPGPGCRIYMNRSVFQMFDIQERADVILGGGLNYGNVNGEMVLNFRKIPIRIVDQLTNSEAQVS